MKKLFCIFFLVGICGLGEGMMMEYVYIPYRLYWGDAQKFCKKYFSDLATFNTMEEQQQLVKVYGYKNDPVWIGLYRKDQNSNWQWSNEKTVSFSAWYNGFPETGCFDTPSPLREMHNFAYLYQGQWQNTYYLSAFPFYCYRHLFLVNELKTWEDALQFCTTYYTSLASLPDDTRVLQAKMELSQTQTDSVWTGLHFMDGIWFWLDGESTENMDLLPSCPARPYHCGALNNITNSVENQDCNKKLNFICYKK